MKNKLIETAVSIAGSVIFSFSVAWIASPAGLVTGGVSGIGIIVKEITGGAVPIFLTSLVLNVPLFIAAAISCGLRFVTNSLIAFGALTVSLSIFEDLPVPLDFEGDMVMSTVMFGILSGIGLGLVLRAGASTGGADMLASIIRRKNPSFSISYLIVIIDIAVIAAGIFVFGVRMSLYAVVAIFICTKVIDIVLSGTGVSKAVFIISDKADEISSRIGDELGRGTTGISAKGMYTGEKRQMLFAVISSRELTRLRKIVAESDRNAFVTISDAKTVLGHGFEEIVINQE